MRGLVVAIPIREAGGGARRLAVARVDGGLGVGRRRLEPVESLHVLVVRLARPPADELASDALADGRTRRLEACLVELGADGVADPQVVHATEEDHARLHTDEAAQRQASLNGELVVPGLARRGGAPRYLPDLIARAFREGSGADAGVRPADLPRHPVAP